MAAGSPAARPEAPVLLDVAAQEDPRAVYRALRAAGAVVAFGEGMVVVPHRRDVEAVLKDPRTFSSGVEAAPLGNVRPLIPLQIDPPRHVKYRRLLDPLFAPRRVGALEGEVAELVGRLVDGFAPRGHCDLHAEFSVPLPCTVFLRLMGLPLEDLDRFLRMKDGIIRPPGVTLEEQDPVRRRTAAEIYAYFEQVVAERRRHPTDDLLGAIVTGEVDGERLSDEEVLDICFLMLIAGLDTVTDSLDCMFAYLATHDEHRRRIVEDPSIVASAVEELLRFESPVPAVARVAVADAEVGGCPVRKGEKVMVLLGSANTDDEVIPDAGEVDLTREPNPHLAFGGGIHRCLGSHLARLELRVALREFHRRIPDYRLAPGTTLRYTPGLRSVEELPLVFEPALVS
jgi:cytochrome P450